MKKSLFRQIIISAVIVFTAILAQAQQQQLIMGRSSEAFPETMSALQEAIKKAGYTISIVQRVDIGLTGMGFQTDKYRIVFFGKAEEIKTLGDEVVEAEKAYRDALAIYVSKMPISLAIFPTMSRW